MALARRPQSAALAPSLLRSRSAAVPSPRSDVVPAGGSAAGASVVVPARGSAAGASVVVPARGSAAGAMLRLPRPLATAPREASQFSEFAPPDPQMQEDLFNEEQLDGDETHTGEMLVPLFNIILVC
jgi:hypothetical protein